jgi:DUF1009 family protein
MNKPVSKGKGRIALIAGEGGLPAALANAGRRGGVDVLVYGVEGLYSSDGAADWTFGLGEIGRLKRRLANDGVKRIVVSGRFYRPDYGAVAWDMGAVTLLPKILKTRMGGDDNATLTILEIASDWGIEVVGPKEIAPQFVAQAGAVSRKRASKAQLADAAFGADVIAGLGRFDIGQAVVVHERRVIAVEAAEGTDQMIARVATLRDQGRFRGKLPSGVLVKMAKPGQELRLDMPVVGVDTIHTAAKAGLAGVAVSAGSVLLADPDAVRAAADAAGLFLVGIAASDATA